MTARRWARRVMLVAGLTVASGGASGCAAGRPLVASPSDYAGYRATRVAPTFDERLAAAALYLKQHPDGAYLADVRRYFERAEPVFFRSKNRSMAGLKAYLRALPRGPHSGEAAERLMELRARYDTQPESRAVVAAVDRRLDRAAAQRSAVRESVQRWLDRFLDPGAWQGPLSEAPADLVVAWSLGLPAPGCAAGEDRQEGRRCTKLLELPFNLPVAGEQEPREATMEIGVAEEASGRPREVVIAGPELFVRLEEARSVKPISADDADARIGAIASAVELVTEVFARRTAIPPACRPPVDAPVVLDLACGGFRVVVRAGGDVTEDDSITIRPHPGAPSP